MNLRENIEKIIASNNETRDKSFMVIMYLENHASLELHENGWLDGDPESKEALFGNDYGLSEKLNKILT